MSPRQQMIQVPVSITDMLRGVLGRDERPHVGLAG